VTQLNNFVESHLGAIGLVIFIGCVVLLLMILMLFVQSQRIKLLSERLDYLTQGADGQSLEDVLASHLDTVVRVARDLDEVAARTAVLEGAARLHFSRLGLVRFNPFDDTGGNQSFAMALLDANNDGFIISSLHSRTGTRIYAKAIFEGICESPLSSEEEKAVGIAVSQGGPVAPAAVEQPEPAPTPVKKPARQRPAAAAGGRASTSSLAKPAPAPRAGRKAGTAARVKADAAAAEPEAGEPDAEAPQA
jgi:hypothetical protein